MNEYIIDILKYFAKFPALRGVQKLFKNKKSTETGYAELKTYIDNLAVNSLIPTIENFIFGMSDDNVLGRLKNIKGKYMYVEFGQAVTTANQYDVKDTQMFLAISIAYPDPNRNFDSIEETLKMEEIFKDIITIEETLITDTRGQCPFAKKIVFPSEKLPIAPADFFNSIGWTMIFHRKLDLHD